MEDLKDPCKFLRDIDQKVFSGEEYRAHCEQAVEEMDIYKLPCLNLQLMDVFADALESVEVADIAGGMMSELGRRASFAGTAEVETLDDKINRVFRSLDTHEPFGFLEFHEFFEGLKQLQESEK